MSKVVSKVHSIKFCTYDNIFKITWEINGKLTNAFSTRGKRIGEDVSDKQKALELAEAYERGDVIVEYLSGQIHRPDAIKRLQKLKFLCPGKLTGHLCTMAEIAAGIR